MDFFQLFHQIKTGVQAPDKAVDVLAELRTERDEARKQLADLLSEAPCPYCGAGVTSKCYGCQVKALEVKLAEARDDLSRLRAAISDGLKQECAPDCAACCVLDAALVVPEAWAEDK